MEKRLRLKAIIPKLYSRVHILITLEPTFTSLHFLAEVTLTLNLLNVFARLLKFKDVLLRLISTPLSPTSKIILRSPNYTQMTQNS